MTRLSRFAVTMLFSVSALLFAQSNGNKAEIGGTVFDQKNAGVPNATVKVLNAATGFQRELKTGEAGQYRFPALDPGTYEINVTAAGLSTTKITDITLTVGSSVTQNIILGVEAVTQTVDVAETIVNLSLPSPSVAISSQQIQDLPINGRRFQDFATLTPSVQVEPQRQQLSFVGQRGVNANVLLDGSDYSQPFFGGIRGGERSNFAPTVPQSAIQEFQVVTQGYAAEYGRSTGGILNAITKSGTNAIHGDGFWQVRPAELSQPNPIVNRKLPEDLYQYGGGIGAPIKKDKWFAFGAIERQQASQPRQILFGALTGFTPNAAQSEAFNYFKGQERDFTQTNNAYAYTLRSDLQFAKGHRLTLRYNQSQNEGQNGVTVGGAANPIVNNTLSNEGIEKNRTNTGTVQYTHIFSPTLINDARFSTQYEIRPRLANSAVPAVTVGSIGTTGARNFLPTTQDDSRIQILDAFTWNKGRHTLKFGFDFARLATVQTFGFNQFGTFSITGSDVATLLQTAGTSATTNRFDAATVTYNRQIGNLVADFGAKQGALFVQDSFHVLRNLTIDLGLRWEGQYNPQVDASNTALVNTVSSVTFPNGSRLDPTRIRNSTEQWMPRVGFAWSPVPSNKRSLVVRGNWGIFYAATPLLWFSGPTNNFRNPPGDVSISLRNTNGKTVYQQLLAVGIDLNKSTLDNLPVIPVDKVQQAQQLATGSTPNPFNGVNLTAMAPDFRNPKSYQFGFGIEGEVASNLVAGIQYNQVKAVYLGRNRDWNLPLPIVNAADGRPLYNVANVASAITRPRPITTINQLTVRESSAQGLYRGLTFSTQYKGKRAILGAFYTVSENFSDSDTERDTGGTEYESNYNLRPEYNFSRLDAKNQFVLNGLYRFPFGIEISGIGRYRSGAPFTPITGADTNGDSYSTDRPIITAGTPAIRNSERNRSFKTIDLRILKSFTFKDRYKVQLSAEFFNAFNFDNVIFAGRTFNYGTGLNPTTGAVVAPLADYRRLRNADGTYFTQNTQLGSPLQSQFGVRFFF